MTATHQPGAALAPRGNFAKATFDAISKTYSYLTPNLWKETLFTKCPYQEFVDHLVRANTVTLPILLQELRDKLTADTKNKDEKGKPQTVGTHESYQPLLHFGSSTETETECDSFTEYLQRAKCRQEN
ncbi:hypothetical protein A6R68_19320 [Neotoma lepida]|uniref:Ribosomal protein S5 C-terminal domain-containing protein n=1 Tax=Neotoma lepida TaxID=56216 RepID=A0A1A6HK03_NEOLE|nr:hypothetical protein A6R68_19320 [Neotoma lepida]